MINIGIHKVKLVDTTGLYEFLLWCRKVVQCSARPEVVLLENIPWASTKTHKTLKFVGFFSIFLFLHHILYIKMMATRKDLPQISSVMIPEMSSKKRKFVPLFVDPL